jgi:hypothetical protein
VAKSKLKARSSVSQPIHLAALGFDFVPFKFQHPELGTEGKIQENLHFPLS